MTQEGPAASMMRSYREAVVAAAAMQWRPGRSPVSAHDLRARAGLPPARTVGDIMGPPFTSAKEPLDPQLVAQLVPFPSHYGMGGLSQFHGQFGFLDLPRDGRVQGVHMEVTQGQRSRFLPPPGDGLLDFDPGFMPGIDELPLVNYSTSDKCFDCRSVEMDGACNPALMGAPKRRKVWATTIVKATEITSSLSLIDDVGATVSSSSSVHAMLVQAAFAILMDNLDVMKSLFCIFMCQLQSGASHEDWNRNFLSFVRGMVVVRLPSNTYEAVPGLGPLCETGSFDALTDRDDLVINICPHSFEFAAACTLWSLGHPAEADEQSSKFCGALTIAMIMVHELIHMIGYQHPADGDGDILPVTECANNLAECVSAGFGYLMGVRYGRTGGCCSPLVSRYGRCDASLWSADDQSCSTEGNSLFPGYYEDKATPSDGSCRAYV
jgi:hypothetical protein